MKKSLFTLMLLACGAMAGCPPAESPHSKSCEGYDCSREGAKQMLLEAARSAGDWSAPAQGQLGQMFDAAADKMLQEQQLTPSGFRKARDNFRKLVANIPHGIDDPAPRAIEQARKGQFFLCPLWPFC